MAHINHEQVKRFAEHLKGLPIGKPLNFYSFPGKDGKEIVASDAYPPLHHEQTQNFFGFMVMHQYRFWNHDGAKYTGPLYGTMNGRGNIKGSDLLNMALMRGFHHDPEMFIPSEIAQLSDKDYKELLFSDDNGVIAFPDLENRIVMSRAYGSRMHVRYGDMDELVMIANSASHPLARFREMMKAVPGYDKDPLEKKNLLLAMALANRPEHYLHADSSDHAWDGIIDYHVERLLLRNGIVELTPEERERSIRRAIVGADEERAIRQLCFDAFNEIVGLSGLPNDACDGLYWSGRRYCPEMEAPKCDPCIFNPVCAKETILFQPVFPETTNY